MNSTFLSIICKKKRRFCKVLTPRPCQDCGVSCEMDINRRVLALLVLCGPAEIIVQSRGFLHTCSEATFIYNKSAGLPCTCLLNRDVSRTACAQQSGCITTPGFIKTLSRLIGRIYSLNTIRKRANWFRLLRAISLCKIAINPPL